MSDKRETWNDLLENSYEYPEALSGVEHRLEKRIAKEQRKKRTLYSSLSAIVAVFSFIILVNASTAFASIVSEIPVLGKLAEYVKFDKSLSSSIENDYIQETGLTAWDGHEKLLLPYVIADEKNMVLFFQLPQELDLESGEWIGISTKNMDDTITGEKVVGFGCSSSNLSADAREQFDGLILQRYHFSEGTLPESIKIDVVLKKYIYDNSTDEKINVNDTNRNEAEPIIETLGTFTFTIDFNEFAKPITYKFNVNHIILDQKITLEDMKVYPTGTEVKFKFEKNNSAWIKGLDLGVEQAGSTVLDGVDGISATYDEENSWMNVFIESDYFEEFEERELIIKGIRLLDKDEEYITVNLNNRTITPFVKGMELKEVTKRDGKADLIFSTKITNNDCFSMFTSKYKDKEGNTYELRSEGSSEYDSQMETRITVEYPESGIVILQRSLTPKIMLEEPIRIKLPLHE